MRTFRNNVIALGVMVALGAVGFLMNTSKAVGQGPPGGLAVNLVNPLPVPVRTVSEPFQPVLANGDCDINPPAGVCSTSLYTVPAGKRLIIEYFSAFANLPSPGDTAAINLADSANHKLYLSLLPPAMNQQFTTRGETSGGQALRMYVGPSSQVFANAERNGTIATHHYQFQISGYLVNATP